MKTRACLAAAFTLLLILAAPRARAAQVPTSMTSERADRPRVAIFFEPDFPPVESNLPDVRVIASSLQGYEVSILDAAALRAALDEGRVDVLVLPFGSAFPQPAWPSIFRYLSRGGSFVNLGGVPFATPVVPAGAGWRPGRRTTSYHKQLGILQAFPVAAARLRFRPAADDDPTARALALDDAWVPRHVYELVVRFTTTKTFPDEDGSDGARDARLTPLVYGFRQEGWLPVAAPFVQIDRLEEEFAGGRWMLATSDAGVSTRSAVALIARAAGGAAELRVQPRYAGFRPGEPIRAQVTFARPGQMATSAVRTVAADVRVTDEGGHVVASDRVDLPIGAADRVRYGADIQLSVDSRTLQPGLYRITASLSVGPGLKPGAYDGHSGLQLGAGLSATSGFWIYDLSMLRGGRRLAAGRDYFTRDGVVFPVAGTTYMASDTHRRFLLEPNAWTWQQDFGSMARAGVNLVRTGIWTGWALHAEADGQPTESMLRALDVFLLTARRHDIPVIFTFFAFVPPAWGGSNPYFDPRSLEAQQRFTGVVAQRFAEVDDIVWDLINEPSFSSPDRLWQCRPNYDENEQAAWAAWLRETVSAPDDAAREAALLDRWNSVAGDGLLLPALRDFRDVTFFGDARPNKAADYRRFAQQAFRRWVGDMTSAIRANGNAAQLITVGQDEGGAGERPSPLLFGDGVDFTGTHTWWNNDALLWDALVAKRSDRPSLVEETGVMTSERPDGTAWRSEEEARNLLERKIAMAFASGAAGLVQWLWNTNVYMPSDNEAGIGFLRADGTARPEVEAFVNAAALVRATGQAFGDRKPEDVAVILPQSALFSARNLATEATQRAIRTLEYTLRVPVRVVSEYAIGDLRAVRRLLVLPSPRVLTENAWAAVLEAVNAGATLLVTGPIDRDEYERFVARLEPFGFRGDARPVAADNDLYLTSKAKVRVTFRGNALERIDGAGTAGEPARLAVISRGTGRIVWSPLPVELAEDEAATAAVYRVAMRLSGVRPAVTVAPDRSGVLVRALHFAQATLVVAVNESNTDADLRVQVRGIPGTIRVRVSADRAQVILVEKRTGKVIRRLHE